ncbi:MAG: glycoside hydrolase family 3 C-terminal domain-containing protein, partial [Luteolibacter sp.]
MIFTRRLTATLLFCSWIPVSGMSTEIPACPLGADHPLEVRVNDLLNRMTLEEMASQLVSRSPAIQRLGIPAFIWDNEGKHAFVSCFPVSIGIAATWNPSLSERVASAISDEARATHNNLVKEGKTQRYLCFWAPTINMARDPRWGRINESFGEDPYLTTQLAIPFIRGIQGNDPKYLKAAAGINHYAVYSEERDRHSVDAIVRDERLLRDYYLPQFEACIKQGGAATVGATNNGLNGVPLCANRFMLNNILRQEWGFNGFVFSDSASVEDLYQTRALVPDAATAAAAALGAGCDINTGLSDTYLKYLPEAVRQSLISKNDVVEACRRVMTVRFRLGLFDPPDEVQYSRITDRVIDSSANRQLARDVAAESIVLLKNEGNILPLQTSIIKRILVTGPRADLPELGRKQTGSSSKNVSALEGIRQRGSAAGMEVVYEKESAASVRAASSSDVVLFFTSLMEGEVSDRMNLDLPPRQEKQLLDLIETGTPIVVVFISGGCVTSERWIEHVPAALAAWYPGEEGGNAIADILFGDVNPSGKLPITFYRNREQLLPFDEFDIRKGMTYQYAKAPVQWSFGHGLGYT